MNFQSVPLFNTSFGANVTCELHICQEQSFSCGYELVCRRFVSSREYAAKCVYCHWRNKVQHFVLSVEGHLSEGLLTYRRQLAVIDNTLRRPQSVRSLCASESFRTGSLSLRFFPSYSDPGIILAYLVLILSVLQLLVTANFVPS
jgi:hypothetical protein